MSLSGNNVIDGNTFRRMDFNNTANCTTLSKGFELTKDLINNF